jgi:hypothetical protein
MEEENLRFLTENCKGTKLERWTGSVSSCWTKRMDQPFCTLIDWLFIILRPAREFWTQDIRRRHHCWSRSTKFRPMFAAQGLWARKGIYRITPAVTRSLCSTDLIRRPTPVQLPLKRCWGLILIWILAGGPFTEKQNLVSISTAKVARQDIWFSEWSTDCYLWKW